MTPEERAALVTLFACCSSSGVDVRAEIAEQIRAAVAEEREACAQTAAEAHSPPTRSDTGQIWRHTAGLDIARLIRARAEGARP